MEHEGMSQSELIEITVPVRIKYATQDGRALAIDVACSSLKIEFLSSLNKEIVMGKNHARAYVKEAP
jgi:hypothetical protein